MEERIALAFGIDPDADHDKLMTLKGQLADVSSSQQLGAMPPLPSRSPPPPPPVRFPGMLGHVQLIVAREPSACSGGWEAV